jgi:hypothetical protein
MTIRALFALALSFALAGPAVTQTAIGPRPLPPPSYGPSATIPPAAFSHSQFTNGFNFHFDVDLAEAQKFLPAGYTAIPSVPGGTTAPVVAIFAHQALLTLTHDVGGFAAGTYGPFDTFDLSIAALPPPGSPRVFEVVFLARFVNNSEIADIRTALNGPGETRLADIEVKVREGFGELRMKGSVEAPDLGLKVVATMTGPDEIAAQLRESPLPLRSLNTDVTPPLPATVGVSFASQDNTATLTDPAALDIGAKQIRLPAGKMKTLGAGPGAFFLNSEVRFLPLN